MLTGIAVLLLPPVQCESGLCIIIHKTYCHTTILQLGTLCPISHHPSCDTLNRVSLSHLREHLTSNRPLIVVTTIWPHITIETQFTGHILVRNIILADARFDITYSVTILARFCLSTSLQPPIYVCC